MSWPGLRALRRALAGRRVCWLVGEQSRDLVAEAADAEAVESWQPLADLRPGHHWRTYQSLEFGSWALDEGREPPAVLVDWLARLEPPGAARPAGGGGIISYDSLHAPRRLGEILRSYAAEQYENDQIVEWEAARRGVGPVRSVAESSAAGWGVSLQASNFKPFVPGPSATREAQHWLEVNGLTEQRWLGIAMTGGSPLKVYPPALLAEVIDMAQGGHQREQDPLETGHGHCRAGGADDLHERGA